MNFDLINVGADALLILIIATSYRMSVSKQAKIEEKISKMLTSDETKKLIEEHLEIIQYEVTAINKTLSLITQVTVKAPESA